MIKETKNSTIFSLADISRKQLVSAALGESVKASFSTLHLVCGYKPKGACIRGVREKCENVIFPFYPSLADIV
ncbi:MAG: hypothetical protein A3D64_00415 [Candidatus Wildermuthbacteria bacterium RIFCSPHIGHO2_02_FULL_49_9]|uniref:Uncharacterized protein n=2 Tax=Parcubacteria group TaxID=1794811 RepID=A0A1F6EHE1_9BACT|nr:MAG: hypothetical protein A3A38_01960 [Candidatus Kaiserbacteria bacterium RIFCSPLOWO2_01_FULL_53_17]OHA70308.1 MAG: hypothetical protein A3D64_00415 [Candidatus Wildermuthbacteria bacterium RIFCSPHIGHO2_02_FULL_49_9]